MLVDYRKHSLVLAATLFNASIHRTAHPVTIQANLL